MHLNGVYRKDCTLKWMCASLAVYVLSAFLTMSVNEGWAIKAGTFFTASLFMLYVPAQMAERDMRKDLFRLGCLMVCLYLPFVLIALLSVFTGRTFRVPGFPGCIGIQQRGAVAERIRIFSNTNITARYMAFNILFSVYAIYVKKNKWLRAFFSVSILIHLIGLAHTQSRTSMIALSAAIGVYAFRAAYMRLWKFRWKIVAAGAACAVAAAVVLSGMNWINKTDIRIAKAMYAQTETRTEAADAGASETRVEKSGQFNVYSSGRGDIWPPAVKYMLNHPEKLVFGLGQGDVIAEIGKEYPQILAYAHLHNSFLSCAVRCGIPFLVCILGFLCTFVRPSWKMLLRRENEENRGLFIVPVFVVMLLIMAVPEEVLFIKEYYANLLFYLMCGYVLRFRHLEKRNANEN